MRPNIGSILTDIKNMNKEGAIAVGVGGLLIGPMMIHSEIIPAMSSIITRAIEIGIGMW